MKHKESKLNGIKKENLRKKFGEKCRYCKCENKFILTIDHKTPLSRGGDDTEANKQTCCFICNQLKGALTHEEFMKCLRALNSLNDLKRLIFLMEAPRVKINIGGFPLTEEYIENEIKKEKELKEVIKKT